MDTAIAGLLGVLITALFTYATQRAAARSAVRQAQLTSRTDIEREAFERAEKYYKGVIDDQNRRINDRDARITALEQKTDRQDQKLRGQDRQLEVLREELDDTKEELDAAKRVLRLRYPDEN